MIERHSRSDFLPDLHVFPGGRVEDQDYALADRVARVAPEDLRRLEGQVPRSSFLAHVVAAIRETFEEAGILLARAGTGQEIAGGDIAEKAARERLDLQSGTVRFRELVERYDLELAADRLALHARWITPEAAPRRFDTLFFTAIAPPGQLARHDGVETTSHLWVRPEQALKDMRAGRLRIILPTAMNLRTLCGAPSAAAALERSRKRPVVAVTPTVEEREGRRRLVIPPEAGYPAEEPFAEE